MGIKSSLFVAVGDGAARCGVAGRREGSLMSCNRGEAATSAKEPCIGVCRRLALIATAIGPLFGVPAVLAQSVTITGQVATSGYVSIGNASFNTPAVTSAFYAVSANLGPPDAPNNT